MKLLIRLAALFAAITGLALGTGAIAQDAQESAAAIADADTGAGADANRRTKQPPLVQPKFPPQTDHVEAAAEVSGEEAEPARPALWKVGDEDTTIYIFGTVHILPPDVEWFDGRIASAFAESDELVTEVVTSDDPAQSAKFLTMAALPEGENLRGLMSAEEKAAYEAGLAGIGLPAGMFDRFEPWYAALLLSSIPILAEGFDPDHGVEELLAKHAKEQEIGHSGLETADFQLGLFDALPMEVQTTYLGEVVSQLPTIKEDIGKMIDAWETGDAETLATLMNSQETDPLLVETLLISRNRNWADWVMTRLGKPGTVFLAVGAGHLSGTDSLMELLAAKGIGNERLQ